MLSNLSFFLMLIIPFSSVLFLGPLVNFILSMLYIYLGAEGMKHPPDGEVVAWEGVVPRPLSTFSWILPGVTAVLEIQGKDS